MFQNNLSLKRYKRVRTKYSTQINEEVFDPNDFITEMKPFFDDRERKYKAYTSEQNEIDRRPKPNTTTQIYIAKNGFKGKRLVFRECQK